MERFVLMAVVSALAMAKPEMYREKEDFKYSRSSSDEGSKSGFYGAQRGNMGGNFERAHNMDGLAQNQMSGLVRQVQGELGEGSKTRTGSVYTAANSKGVYGSGNYDLSNLEGRNFQEGVSFDDSQALSSLSSHAGYNVQSSASSNSGAYSTSDSQRSRFHSGFNGYSGQSSRHSGQTYDSSGQSSGNAGQVGNLQELDNTRAVRRYDYGGQEAIGHYSQSGYHGQSVYDHSNTHSQSSNDYGVNSQSRRITAMPVRVVIRPGTKVPVPIAAESLNTAHTATAYDQNLVNSDTEILNNQNHYNVYKPAGQAKHYESAYSYHKEWEKHDTKPVVPTENPFPKNSELYEDTQAHVSGQQYDSTAIDSQNSHLSNAYSAYNTNAKSTSSNQYQHQYNSNEKESKLASALSSNTNTYAGYNSGLLNTDVNNQIENVDNKPKSYQSSYSYHKSWERQGDPYVIKPVSGVNGAQESQKLTAASGNQGSWSSHQYGSRLQKNRQYYVNAEDCDCEDDSHKRVARSYNNNQHQQRVYYDPEETGQQTQNLGQQTQNKWENLEETGQQTVNQWGNLETLGQQTQNQWGKLEDAGQQTLNKWDKLEDLGQQTQNQWNTIREELRPEDVEQETQNTWIHQPYSAVQPDANQQIQNTWLAQSEVPVTHDLHYQTQNTWIGQSNIEVQEDQKPKSNWDINKPSEQEITDVLVPRGIVFHHNKDFNKLNVPNAPFSTADNTNNPDSADSKISEDSTKPKKSFVGDNYDIHFNNKPYLSPSAYNVPAFTNFPSQLDNTFYSKFGNIQTWSNEQNTHFNQHFQTYGNNRNFYGQSHRQNDWLNQVSFEHTGDNFSKQNVQSTPTLSNLWNKIDTIEKQFSSNNDSQPSLTDKQTQQVDTEKYSTEYFSDKPYRSPYTHNWQTYVNDTTEEENRQPNGNNDKILTTDVGRGDIGPEEQIDQINTSTEKILKGSGNEYKTNILQPKPYKTLADMDSLSQTLDMNRTQNQQQIDSSVTIIREQKPNDSIMKLTTTGNPHVSTSYDVITPVLKDTKITEIDKIHKELSSGKTNKDNLENFVIQTNSQNNSEQPIQIFGQQDKEQYENFGYQNPAQEQQNTEQQFENFDQQSSTLEQQFENIDPQSSTIEQQNADSTLNQEQFTKPVTEQANAEQQFETFGQDKSLGQQNTEQSEKFGQERPILVQQNTEQQFENKDQQSSTLEQQNAEPILEQQFAEPTAEQENTDQQFEIFGQQNTPLGHQNTEQQFENTNQQSSTLKQENAEPILEEHYAEPTAEQSNTGQFENFDPLISTLVQQNTEQQFENFDQQSPTLEQQNTEQQFENIDPQRSIIEQQNADSTLNQKQLAKPIAEQANAEQQFETFGQDQSLGQQIIEQSEKFGQQRPTLVQQNTEQQFENINQQSSTLEQQNAEPILKEQFAEPTDEQSNTGQFENFDQPISALVQQNTEQKFESFRQQNQPLEQQKTEQQFENTDQQNSTLQQQNADSTLEVQFAESTTEQQFEISGQQNQPFGHLNTDQSENFGQQSPILVQQNTEQQFENTGLNDESYGNNQQQVNRLEVLPVNEAEPRTYYDENKYSQNDYHQRSESEISSINSTDTPPEVSTEKSGFWKNVGDKFANAKNKVFSWFQGS